MQKYFSRYRFTNSAVFSQFFFIIKDFPGKYTHCQSFARESISLGMVILYVNTNTPISERTIFLGGVFLAH